MRELARKPWQYCNWAKPCPRYGDAPGSANAPRGAAFFKGFSLLTSADVALAFGDSDMRRALLQETQPAHPYCTDRELPSVPPCRDMVGSQGVHAASVADDWVVLAGLLRPFVRGHDFWRIARTRPAQLRTCLAEARQSAPACTGGREGRVHSAQNLARVPGSRQNGSRFGAAPGPVTGLYRAEPPPPAERCNGFTIWQIAHNVLQYCPAHRRRAIGRRSSTFPFYTANAIESKACTTISHNARSPTPTKSPPKRARGKAERVLVAGRFASSPHGLADAT